MSLNQRVAEFSFCTPSAPPLTYTFKLTGHLASSAAFSSRQLGILYPHKGTSWLANLLNPVVLIIHHAPNPYSIRLITADLCEKSDSAGCLRVVPR